MRGQLRYAKSKLGDLVEDGPPKKKARSKVIYGKFRKTKNLINPFLVFQGLTKRPGKRLRKLLLSLSLL